MKFSHLINIFLLFDPQIIFLFLHGQDCLIFQVEFDHKSPLTFMAFSGKTNVSNKITTSKKQRTFKRVKDLYEEKFKIYELKRKSIIKMLV